MSWAELHDAAAGLVGRIGLVYHAPTTSDLVALGRYVERVTAAYAALCPREIDVGAETRAPLCACGHVRALHDVSGRCFGAPCVCPRWHPRETEPTAPPAPTASELAEALEVLCTLSIPHPLHVEAGDEARSRALRLLRLLRRPAP